MLDNITFIDLVALMRITPESTVERFGGLINSSFFDASNILGSLKQKGLVDFITQFPSQSAITVTDQGKQLIAEVQQKDTTPFDALDLSILHQLSNGNRTLPELTGAVNVTTKDLAMHLHKLSVQQFISFELRNGNMNIMLTEKGFLRVKEGIPASEAQAQQPASQQNAASVQTAQAMTTPGAKPIPKTAEDLKNLETQIISGQKQKRTLILAAVIIVVIALAALYFTNIL
jgi:DNA-binding MarR family transcriptional regulator